MVYMVIPPGIHASVGGQTFIEEVYSDVYPKVIPGLAQLVGLLPKSVIDLNSLFVVKGG